MPVEGVPTIPPQPTKLVYSKKVKATHPMNLNELNALAQDLRNERRDFQRKADYAQECLNEIQRKMAIMKLEAQMDTPMGEMMGG